MDIYEEQVPIFEYLTLFLIWFFIDLIIKKAFQLSEWISFACSLIICLAIYKISKLKYVEEMASRWQ